MVSRDDTGAVRAVRFFVAARRKRASQLGNRSGDSAIFVSTSSNSESNVKATSGLRSAYQHIASVNSISAAEQTRSRVIPKDQLYVGHERERWPSRPSPFRQRQSSHSVDSTRRSTQTMARPNLREQPGPKEAESVGHGLPMATHEQQREFHQSYSSQYSRRKRRNIRVDQRAT